MSVVYLLPVFCFLVFQVTFILTYIASIIKNHVIPTFPYISDTASFSPESCFFAQLINTGCVLLGLTFYVRYRQIIHVMDHHQALKETIGKMNKCSFYFGLASCYGFSIVANFQVSNVRYVHYFGAFSTFGLGIVYIWYQTFISQRIEPYITLRKSSYRFILSVTSSFFFVIIVVCGIVAKSKFDGIDPLFWYPSINGWAFHVISTISEWIVSTIFSFYILSFTDEFKYVDFDHPDISFIIIEQDFESVSEISVRALDDS